MFISAITCDAESKACEIRPEAMQHQALTIHNSELKPQRSREAETLTEAPAQPKNLAGDHRSTTDHSPSAAHASPIPSKPKTQSLASNSSLHANSVSSVGSQTSSDGRYPSSDGDSSDSDSDVPVKRDPIIYPKCEQDPGHPCIGKIQEEVSASFCLASFSSFGASSGASSSSQLTPPSSHTTYASTSSSEFTGQLFTTTQHNPILGTRHFYMPVRDPVVEFTMPSACAFTKGVAVVDILAFDGQCVDDPTFEPFKKLIGTKLGATYIDLVLEWKGHSRRAYRICIRCRCGSSITRGQLALEISFAHEDYFATEKCCESYRNSNDVIRSIDNLRLMSLYTPDNGATWKAQHAMVESTCVQIVAFPTPEGEIAYSDALYLECGQEKRHIAWTSHEAL